MSITFLQFIFWGDPNRSIGDSKRLAANDFSRLIYSNVISIQRDILDVALDIGFRRVIQRHVSALNPPLWLHEHTLSSIARFQTRERCGEEAGFWSEWNSGTRHQWDFIHPVLKFQIFTINIVLYSWWGWNVAFKHQCVTAEVPKPDIFTLKINIYMVIKIKNGKIF